MRGVIYDYIKLILTFDDKPINIPTSDEIENMANSSDIQSSASPKKEHRTSSCVLFLSSRPFIEPAAKRQGCNVARLAKPIITIRSIS